MGIVKVSSAYDSHLYQITTRDKSTKKSEMRTFAQLKGLQKSFVS